MYFSYYLPIKGNTKVISVHISGIQVIISSGTSTNQATKHCLEFNHADFPVCQVVLICNTNISTNFGHLDIGVTENQLKY